MCTLVPAAMSSTPYIGRDQLILQSVPLVRRAVGRYIVSRPSILEPEDVLSYGTMGLIDAVDRYDRNRGVKFETYAVTRIRGFLVDQLRSIDWLPRSARTNIRVVQTATAELEETLGRKPLAGEVSERTGLPDTTCKQALTDCACRVVSLEAITPDSDEVATNLVRHLEDESSPNPATALERKELHCGVVQALQALPQREREVVQLKYVHEWTYREIAKHLGVSESRVSQLHSQGLTRMRRALVADFGQPDGELLSA